MYLLESFKLCFVLSRTTYILKTPKTLIILKMKYLLLRESSAKYKIPGYYPTVQKVPSILFV